MNNKYIEPGWVGEDKKKNETITLSQNVTNITYHFTSDFWKSLDFCNLQCIFTPNNIRISYNIVYILKSESLPNINTSEIQCVQDHTFTSRNMIQLTRCLVHIWHKHMEHSHVNINTTWSEQNTKSINHIIYPKYACEAVHYARQPQVANTSQGHTRTLL